MTSWETVRLGDLCSIKSGKSDTKDAVADGPYAFFDRSRTIKRSTRYLYDCEALIIPGEGAEFLPRHFDGKFDLHQRAYALFDFSDRVDVRFLYYYLVYASDYFARVAVGATVKSLRLRHFQQLPVLITSLAEQRRLVRALDEATRAIESATENTVTNAANARELFHSVLRATLDRRGAGWEDRALGDVCGIARGGSPRPIKAYLTSEPDGINWIKISDATASGKYIFETREKIKPEGVNKSRLVRDGDLLLSNSMSFGRPYIMRTEGCIHDGWLVLSDYADTLDQDYLYHVLGSELVYEQFDRMAAGSTVRNLNINLASKAVIPIPPLAVQREIAARLEQVNAKTAQLAAIYENKTGALSALRQSLLDRAFRNTLEGAIA